jgi:hypothetical protein
LSEDEIEEFVEELLKEQRTLICIDDIDTLTTAGIDPGIDALYSMLARSKNQSKVLYTVRNQPAHSINQSVEVPGLRLKGEYEEFLRVSSNQFGVPAPNNDEATKIYNISEGRPLLVEAIVSARRSLPNYETALSLFEERGGDQARDYIFRREWAALGSDHRSRTVLAILSMFNRPVRFSELLDISRFDENQLKDAISECAEMFIRTSHEGEETKYTLSQTTKSFVSLASPEISKIEFIKERVGNHKKTFLPNNPKLSTLLSDATKLVAFKDIDGAISVMTREKADPKVSEDPRYKEFMCNLSILKSDPVESYEYFSEMKKDKYEPEAGLLKRLLFLLNENSCALNERLDVCDYILRGKYAASVKCEFMSHKGGVYYFSAREMSHNNQEKTFELHEKAINMHIRAFYLHCKSHASRVEKSEEFARNTMHSLCQFSRQAKDLTFPIDLVKRLDLADHFYLDPILDPVVEHLRQIKTNGLLTDRIRGNYRQFALWLDGRLKSKFEQDMRRIQSIESINRHLN